ncbi:SET and MYND domain-containing protein 4-like [Pollicipes pollicipes]|uniref:SET and MYND domain-containing protein 4-like n=1 Tax=Pollicipes pollicipes TaxID=41117 RepID=UPI001884CCED|nr:SET and MYND domain-containing protein 4-like [Pollicipes pollicipes]
MQALGEGLTLDVDRIMLLQVIAEEGHVARFFEDTNLRRKLSALQSAPQLKDDALAKSQRESGNKSFRAGRFCEALRQYGECVMGAASAETLSCGFANRSAALFHLEQFEDSLRDMESALAAGYASERHHKLHVRRARCHLALGRPDSARSALVQYRAAVHDLHLGDTGRF